MSLPRVLAHPQSPELPHTAWCSQLQAGSRNEAVDLYMVPTCKLQEMSNSGQEALGPSCNTILNPWNQFLAFQLRF